MADPNESYKLSLPVFSKDWNSKEDDHWDNYNKILVIGDVHCKIEEYKKIINSTTLNSIQVGDFGFGIEHRWHLQEIDSSKHKINFGNHDNYYFLNSPHSLGDYSFQFQNQLMTIRGAESIDKATRFEGIDWWREEEIEYLKFQEIIDLCVERKPRIIISHDCPQSIQEKYFNIYETSRTSGALQFMFQLYQPELWIFGHHHESFTCIENNTKFICLNELETLEIEI